MIASHITGVRSDNSVSQSATPKTDPQTREVVQLAHQQNGPTNNADVDSVVGQFSKAPTESHMWWQDSHNEYLIDETASSRMRPSHRILTPTTEAS
jgi:hypothetical protein